MTRKLVLIGIGLAATALACSLTGLFQSAVPFTPTADVELEGGEHRFTEMHIPEGVTVTLAGDVQISVEGDTQIDGTLTGDCVGIEIRGEGGLAVDGLITNECTDPDAEGKEIRLVASGDIVLGSAPSDEPVIVSSGSVFISDPGGENLDLDAILPQDGTSLRPRERGAGHLAAPLEQGGSSTSVNRPVRAGRGADGSVVRDQGDININANITAENGKDAPALSQNGNCDNSNNIGGTGGSVRLAARNGGVVVGNGARLEAGDGGKGGSCTADVGCPATATAGRGGSGGSVLVGGQRVEFGAGVSLKRGNGGPGGDATATADDATAPCGNGCSASATAGLGGDAGGIGYLILEPGTITGSPTVEGANGGKGGLASAMGGDGEDCDTCPAGLGGAGGPATSAGGQGGNGGTGTISGWATAPNSHLKGDGGDAVADGGFGGEGATCCDPPIQGGDGGPGGDATATGGQIGAKGLGGGGVRGHSQQVAGGNGGDGGDGLPPGAGGAEGIGSGDPDDIPDGLPGFDGEYCTIYLSGVYVVQITIILDPAGHAIFISMPVEMELDIIVDLETGTIVIFGPFPWVAVEGEIDELGNFTASGFGIVAGFNNVQVELEGQLTLAGLSGEYSMGTNRALPTGQAITYGVSGSRQEQEPEDPEEFAGLLEAAIREGDLAFLVSRLHPAVIDLYGLPTCKTYLSNFRDPAAQIMPLSVSGPARWDWMVEDVTIPVPNVYTVTANVSGATEPREVHFGLMQDGRLGWFLDCGNKLP